MAFYLNTVADYINYARILVQDQVQPYRYLDTDFITALNLAFTEAYRLRPDLFLPNPTGIVTIPSENPADDAVPPDTDAVNIDPRYQIAIVYYMVGQVQLRDEEYTQDSRAAMFISKFTSILVES